MTIAISHENELLLKTLRDFMDNEIYPHEEEVDRLGDVPEELGRQIQQRSMDALSLIHI